MGILGVKIVPDFNLATPPTTFELVHLPAINLPNGRLGIKEGIHKWDPIFLQMDYALLIWQSSLEYVNHLILVLQFPLVV